MPLSDDVIQFSKYGGLDVLSFRQVELMPPGNGDIQIRHHAIGVNYIDIYQRKGVFAPKLPLPGSLGVEGVGESSGPVAPLQISALGAKGSLFVTRPSIAHYTADRADYEAAAKRLFSAMATGTIKTERPLVYPLQQGAQAHADLEGRKTKGAVVLLP